MKFSTATNNDIPEMIEVLTAAFNQQDDDKFRAQQKADITGHLDQWRVARDQGTLVGTLHVHRHELWCGQCRLLKGDVGGVAVNPACQGRGVGSRLMRDAVNWMHGQEYHLSRLGGLCSFYSRFGYHPFLRRYVEFPVPQRVRAGASRIPFTETLTLKLPGTGEVRDLDPERDMEQVWDLEESFSRHRTGAMVFTRPDAPPSAPGTNDLRLVYADKDQVLGVLYGREAAEEVSPFEARLMIGALAYDTNHPEALEALIKQVLRRAAHKKIPRVTARLPFDPIVFRAMDQANIGYARIDYQGATASNMLQIVNLRALLATLAPEFARRLAGSAWQGAITFDIGKESATLRIVPEAEPEIEPGTSQGAKPCKIHETDFLRLVLGLESPTGLGIHRRNNLQEQERQLLESLFPVQPTASGAWG